MYRYPCGANVHGVYIQNQPTTKISVFFSSSFFYLSTVLVCVILKIHNELVLATAHENAAEKVKNKTMERTAALCGLFGRIKTCDCKFLVNIFFLSLSIFSMCVFASK